MNTVFMNAFTSPITGDSMSGIILMLCISGVALLILILLTFMRKGKK